MSSEDYSETPEEEPARKRRKVTANTHIEHSDADGDAPITVVPPPPSDLAPSPSAEEQSIHATDTSADSSSVVVMITAQLRELEHEAQLLKSMHAKMADQLQRLQVEEISLKRLQQQHSMSPEPSHQVLEHSLPQNIPSSQPSQTQSQLHPTPTPNT